MEEIKFKTWDKKKRNWLAFDEIEFEVIEDIYWDNWGRAVEVFSKGQRCKGKLLPDGDVIAESPYYEGISDLVDREKIKIVRHI